MRAVLIDPPESFMRQRHERGADRWDEVWEGVLHTVPPPRSWHQRFGFKLASALDPIAESVGLIISYETGVFRPGPGERDYRVPDLVVARPKDVSKRGVEGAAQMVIEILSEGDESREKLPFYESVGVAEVLLVDPDTRAHELYVLRGDKLHIALPQAGAVQSQVLGVSFSTADGPRFRLAWDCGAVEI
jgi:Uma2 family endonuclease